MAEYILKQAALDALQSEGITRNMRVYKKVQDIQAADVAPMRHGKYISTGPDELYCDFGECSLCGGDMPLQSKFCPHCAAKMDGEVEKP